ncbi:MAG: LytTR family DNA-binding domain-containing protein [Granulosicoccus sp.]
MIDSSGRRALRADGTVLDLMPIGQAIAVTGVLLVALFVLIKPEASNGLGTAGRIVFWTLHVGLGLGALAVSSRWLASREHLPSGTLAAVLVSGCAAIVIAAPGYLALDALFSEHVIDLDPDPDANSITVSLIGELLDLAPWFMVAWLLINLPVLLPRPMLNVHLNDEVDHFPDDDPTSSPEPESIRSRSSVGGTTQKGQTAATQSRLFLVSKELSDDIPTPQVDSRGERFLSSLPGIVGTDVVAVASDLHYLNVWTVAGRTTVLGKLKDVVDDLGDEGMQVHRSHWVSHAHVRRIVGTASDAACILSNELRVPVSRRRWKAVRSQYGRGVVNAAVVPNENTR